MINRGKHMLILIFTGLFAGQPAAAQFLDSFTNDNTGLISESSERQFTGDDPLQLWSGDEDFLASDFSDRFEIQNRPSSSLDTIKLTGVVPPIYFESGVANIPESTVTELANVLESVRDRLNVRLHLVGHADTQRLSPALALIYGDNEGLSRERAGEVAEFLQSALTLPASNVSYEWAGDTRPVASNDSEAGRALNRRVEVEVWYDEPQPIFIPGEVLVQQPVNRIKVCRTQTLCKLQYEEGRGRRARIQNLIPPLLYDETGIDVTPEFIDSVSSALAYMSDRSNVVIRFVGYSDDAPLADRNVRIYGDHTGLSAARARRVAVSLQEALGLAASAVESEGRGIVRPIAVNDSMQGRALNRRVEVEFWYDDPLQVLPDEPQICPAPGAAGIVTRVFEPPWGPIPQVAFNNGQPGIPASLAADLQRALAAVDGRDNVRVRLLGYTENVTLDRRTALVYGDDIGLAAARARRVMNVMSQDVGLPVERFEVEGRGFVQSEDVVNTGFVQGPESYVVVQVVYDEVAESTLLDGVQITPMRQEFSPQNPFGLNLMRITVDGEPLDDPERSFADVQRCTDVALDDADIAFAFDNLSSERRLSSSAEPNVVSFVSEGSELVASSDIQFATYTNYAHFIANAEIRVFERSASTRSEPLDVIPVPVGGMVAWTPPSDQFLPPVRELKYVLRAYSADGKWDETTAAPLSLTYLDLDEAAGGDRAVLSPADTSVDADPQTEMAGNLLANYGESMLSIRNIELSSGTVTVRGGGIPSGHSVWIAGQPVPVDASGNFVSESILPTGLHSVEVSVLDAQGNGEVFLRDLEFEPNDWFYVGMADITLAQNDTSGAYDLLQGDNSRLDLNANSYGRLAFFVNGKFGGGWKLAASADTREAPLDELLSNFTNKAPDALFRRLDPDYHYPTFGDDSIVQEGAPSQDRLYLRVDRGQNHGMWGNFNVAYMNNELAQIDRGLYGGRLHYESSVKTGFGESRFGIDGFAAEPGTIASREEFRGTGGSLYFLRQQDLLMGSERVRIEVRDKASGIVTGVLNLRPILDYDIDYLQGRILLAEPLLSTVGDDLLVRSNALSGNEAYLVVRYEYTPGFDQIDSLSVGGQVHFWINDNVRLGLTANSNEQGDIDSALNGADLTLRKTEQTWLRLQTGQSEGFLTNTYYSADGGYGFDGTDGTSFVSADAGASRIDLSVALEDFFAARNGRIQLYNQELDAGYAGPGMITDTDASIYGIALALPVNDNLAIRLKSDNREHDGGLQLEATEVNVSWRINNDWNLDTGIRQDVRRDESDLAPATQSIGERSDAVIQLGYQSGERWRAYGFVQETLDSTESREENSRFGVGGTYQLSERLGLDMELSDGDLGRGGSLGTSYTHSDRTSFYMNYALETERTDNGLRAARGSEGQMVAGARTRFSDSTSLFLEERYQSNDDLTGLTHSTGITFAPNERLNLSATTDIGTLQDSLTGAETDRTALGVQMGYGIDRLQFSSGVEYRVDDMQQPDLGIQSRTTWLFRNNFKYQLSPAMRLLGKLNHSESESSQGQFYDGGFTEAVFGAAVRPVRHDRFNAIAKYTYFYNVPTTGQITLQNTAAEYIQRTHVASLDMDYDLTARWSVGAKYAYRVSEVSIDRNNPQFFDNGAQLVILRADWEFRDHWDVMFETRALDMLDLDERRSGGLIVVSRALGKNLKAGVGYNFTDFSSDLTDLNFDHKGSFISLTGAL